jgi:hypothetical protein
LDHHVRLTCVSLLASLAVVTGCAGETENLTPFLGSFEYSDGEISATCGGVRISEPLAGMSADVTDRNADELEYIAGPRCRLTFRVEDSKAAATPGQTCELAVQQTIATGRFDFAELVLEADTLILRAAGIADVLIPRQEMGFTCERFELVGTLSRRED